MVVDTMMIFSQRRQWLTLVTLLIGLLIGLGVVSNRQWQVPLNLGLEEGINNDAPFVVGFNAGEQLPDRSARYRWSTLNAQLRFPHVPQRHYWLDLPQLTGNPVSLIMGTSQFTSTAGRVLHVLLPADAAGKVAITVAQPVVSDDPRELGAAFSGGQLSSSGWAWPALYPTLAWLFLLTTLGLSITWLGGSSLEVGSVVGLTGLGIVAATWFAPLRASYAAPAIVQTTLYGLAALLLLRWALPPILQRLGLTISRDVVRWLILATVLVWALKLGGRLLLEHMPGDIGFHRNRIHATNLGDLFRPSRHRGIDFPYPPVLYALLQPLTLTGISADWLLQLTAAACEALAIPVLFCLGLRTTGSSRGALIGAIIYGLVPAGFMTNAWSFDSHIFSQFVALLLATFMVWTWQHWHERRNWLWMTLGLSTIALGHFGFYLNTGLMGGLLMLWLWWRGPRSQGLALFTSLVATQVIVWALYYSSFIGLFLQQGQSFAEGGMNAVNQREAVPRLQLLWDMIELGFWRHYGLLPVLIAPFGWWLSRKDRGLQLVMGATFVVSLILAAFPIINGSTITTRWLMFSAWAIALTTGIALDWLWQRTRWGRWPAILITSGCAIFGMIVWFAAMVYKIRPPEPF